MYTLASPVLVHPALPTGPSVVVRVPVRVRVRVPVPVRLPVMMMGVLADVTV